MNPPYPHRDPIVTLPFTTVAYRYVLVRTVAYMEVHNVPRRSVHFFEITMKIDAVRKKERG